MKKSKFASAFTLVELLVVVTIIAVLTALVLPALRAAKERGQAAGCASNLKQVGSVYQTYLTDHSGFYPYISPECIPIPKPGVAPCSGAGTPATNAINPCANYVGPSTCVGSPYVYLPQYYLSDGNWDPSCPWATTNLWSWDFPASECCDNHWVWQLAPYFGATCKTSTNYATVMRCPGTPFDWGQPTMYVYYSAYCTYRMNGQMFPCTYRGSWGSANGSIAGTPAGFSKMVNMTDISNPAGLMLLGEAANYPGNYYWNTSVSYAKNPSMGPCYVTNCNFGSFCDNHFTQANGAYDEPQVTPSKSCNALIAYWHNNGMNVLMIDGHVQRVDKATLKTYSAQQSSGIGSTPGGIFWGDGKGSGCGSAWYSNQYPGGPWPYNQ